MEWSWGWVCWFVPLCLSVRHLEGQLNGQCGGQEQRMGMVDTCVALWQSTHHHGRLNLSLPQIASRDTEDEALL